MIPWVVTSADRDGKPRIREWRNPLGMDYITVIDEPGERSHSKNGGRYGIYDVKHRVDGFYPASVTSRARPALVFSGVAFATIPALTAHLRELKALNRANDVYAKIAKLAPPDLLDFMVRNRDQVMAAIEAAFATTPARSTPTPTSTPTTRAERVRVRLQHGRLPGSGVAFPSMPDAQFARIQTSQIEHRRVVDDENAAERAAIDARVVAGHARVLGPSDVRRGDSVVVGIDSPGLVTDVDDDGVYVDDGFVPYGELTKAPTKPAIDVLGMARDVWTASKEREDRALLLELLQVARLAADLDEDTKEKALAYLTVAAPRLAALLKPPQDSDVPDVSDVENVDYADPDKIDETSDRFAHASRSRGYMHRLMCWQALSLTPAELARLIPYARGLWKAQLRSARESLLGVQRWIRKDHLFRADNSAKNVTIGTRVRATAQYAKGGTTQGPTQAGYGVAISAGNQDAKDAIGTTAAMLVQFDPPQPPRRITPAFDILNAETS